MNKKRMKGRWAAWILSLLLIVGIIPVNAFAAEKEHVHTEECYEEILICQEQDSAVHVHTEECQQTEQVLVCDEEHEHTDECYEEQSSLVCGLEETESAHVHTEECYETVLVCGEEAGTSETGLSEEELSAVQQLIDAIDQFLEKYDPQQEYGEEELAALNQEKEEILAGFEALSEEAQLLVDNYDAFDAFVEALAEASESNSPAVSQAVLDLTASIDQFLADFDLEKNYTEEEQTAWIERLEAIQDAFDALSEEEQLQVTNIVDLLSLIQDGGGVFFANVGGEAVISGTSYDSMGAALSAAKTGDVVVLQKDVELTNYYYLQSGNSVTLDLNGHNVTSASTAFMVKKGSELTLTGSGTISGNGYSKKGGALVVWGGVINLEGDVVLTPAAANLSEGGAVWIYYGTFNMNGGRIEGGSAKYGGGVSVPGYNKSNPSTFNMSGGVISGCHGTDGGGVFVDLYGYFNMSGGVIENCTAEVGAGVYEGGNMVFSGGEIVNNTAEYHSGGVYVDGDFTMTGGIIAHNKVVDGGIGDAGGVYQTFNGATVKVSGGAVFGNENGDFTVNGYGTVSILPAKQMQAEGLVFTGWHVKPDEWSGQKERDTEGPLPDQALAKMERTTYTAVYDQGEAVYSQTIVLGGPNSSAETFEEAKMQAEQMIASEKWNKEPIVIQVGKTLSVSGTEEWSFGENAESIIMERSPSFDGYLVNVTGSLTLEDITIQGLGIGLYKKSLIKVTGKGQLTIQDGTVLQNNGAGGTGSVSYDGGAVYADSGKVIMTGGEIRNNASSYLGGGVSISSATFEMTGGEISGNTSDCGGGVSVVRGGKFLFFNGEISGNTAGIGGGICIGGRTTAEAYDEPSMTMDGGSVSGNTAKENGGGIYVQMNSMATITAGDIIGNQTLTYGTTSHRGGGIYVNGGPGANSGIGHQKPLNASSGMLQLYNVEITGNSAPSGGGLAACPTSQVKIYLTDGAVFHDNFDTRNLDDEIDLSGSSSSEGVYYISDFMLGGGMYQWYSGSGATGQLADRSQYQNTSKLVHLSNICSDEDIAKAQALATVRIADNTTNGHGYGGGIASNGAIIIGTPDESTAQVTVSKLWDDNNDKYGKRPESIEVSIQYGALTLTNLQLTAENNWTITKTGLTQEILAGLSRAELEVKEIKVDGYEFQGATAKVIGEEVIITLTNRYVPKLGSLKISKTVTGSDGDRTKGFTFSITLRDGNGTVLQDSYPYSGKGTGTIGSGDRITLKDGESITIRNLPAGTTYTVTEIEANRDGYTTTATGNQGVIVADTTATASFVNDRPGTPPPPTRPEVPEEPKDPDPEDPGDPPDPPERPERPPVRVPREPDPDPDPRTPNPPPPTTTTIVDPNVPLANNPSNLVTIKDPMMPLGNLPITGGYGMALVIAGATLLGIAILKKK